MNGIIIGLVPALLWGIQPLVMQKLGGKPGNQTLGMAIGSLCCASLVVIFYPPSSWSLPLIIASFLCGVMWAFGQFTQISTYSLLGVSRATPIATGMLLLTNSLVGIFYFNEWDTPYKLLLGCIALVIIIVGIIFTAYQEKSTMNSPANLKAGLLLLLVSTGFYTLWVTIPRFANLNGWDVVFPQAIGGFLFTYIICRSRKDLIIWHSTTYKNIFTGLIFFISSLCMMLSNQMNGLAVGFTLTQMFIVISGIGGIVVLKERKTRKELIVFLCGLALVALGGILIGSTKL